MVCWKTEILQDKLQLPDATVLPQPFTTISKQHMNITMQHYNIIINGVEGGGGGGRIGMFKGRYVLS